MKFIAFDTETTGLRLQYDDYMFAFSTCNDSGEIEVHRVDGRGLAKSRADRALRRMLKDGRPIVCHNAKFDIVALENYLGDYTLHDTIPFHDTYIQSHLMRNDHPSHRLKELAYEHFDIGTEDESRVKEYAVGNNYQTVPEDVMNEYQYMDAYRCALLHMLWYPKIRKDECLLDIYRQEIKLIRVTISMERRGLRIDRRECDRLSTRLRDKASNVLDAVEKKTGRRLNLNATADVAWMLYDFGKLPIKEYTPTGKPKTTKDILLELKEESDLPDYVMQYRSYSKGAQMVKGYAQRCDDLGIIHPSINTNGAVTGRESCSDPNLQNVSKEGVLLNPYAIPARSVFKPRPGYVNIHIDYSGIEMRLLIHYSRDVSMIKVVKEGGDVHLPGMKIFFREKYDDFSPEEFKSHRNAMKNVNFAICYGAGAAKVAGALRMSMSEAVKKYKEYKMAFPKLVELPDRITKNVQRDGFILTTFGRRLHVPRNMGYVGTNYLIQGTAAQILKEAQNRVYDYLKKEVPDAHLLLPIHDELIFEWPRKEMKSLQHHLRRIRELMIDFSIFNVPLEIDVSLSTVNWAKAVDYGISY